MTPEEKVVIQAAIKWWHSRDSNVSEHHELYETVQNLVYRCNDCNYDRHTCPGDGLPIKHGETDCGQHGDEPITSEQRERATYLGEYASDVVQEWMRIVEMNGDVTEPGSGSFQARANWQGAGRFTLGSSRYSDDLGIYQLTVRVDPVYVPPIGPENDPAMIEEMKSEPEWVETTWQFVIPEDSIRLPNGTQIAVVQTMSVEDWHLDDPKKWWQAVKGKTYGKVSVHLAHLPGRLLTFSVGAPVSILMDAERSAVHTFQVAFPGMEVIDS